MLHSVETWAKKNHSESLTIATYSTLFAELVPNAPLQAKAAIRSLNWTEWATQATKEGNGMNKKWHAPPYPHLSKQARIPACIQCHVCVCVGSGNMPKPIDWACTLQHTNCWQSLFRFLQTYEKKNDLHKEISQEQKKKTHTHSTTKNTSTYKQHDEASRFIVVIFHCNCFCSVSNRCSAQSSSRSEGMRNSHCLLFILTCSFSFLKKKEWQKWAPAPKVPTCTRTRSLPHPRAQPMCSHTLTPAAHTLTSSFSSSPSFSLFFLLPVSPLFSH